MDYYQDPIPLLLVIPSQARVGGYLINHFPLSGVGFRPPLIQSIGFPETQILKSAPQDYFEKRAKTKVTQGSDIWS